MLIEDTKRLSKDFPFEMIHYKESRSSFQVNRRPHWHRFFEITYVEKGEAVYEVGEKIYQAQAGDILLFNHIEAHRWRPESDTLELIVMMFAPELIADGCHALDMDYLLPFLERNNKFQNLIRKDSQYTELIKYLLDEIMEEKNREQTGSRLMIKADILKILTLLVRHYEQDMGECSPNEQRKDHLLRLEPAFAYIRKNYGKKITLEETAACVCLSPHYFSGSFKKATGYSFQEYLGRVRMERARDLLHHSNYSILEIAEECGINSSANFYRLFKKYYGTSPGIERERKII